MKLSSLTSGTRTIHMDYDGEDLEVTYRASEFTAKMATSDELGDGPVELLVRLLVTWDVLDEQGDRLEPTADVLRSLPIRFLNYVVAAIAEDSAPDPPKRGTSGGRSR